MIKTFSPFVSVVIFGLTFMTSTTFFTLFAKREKKFLAFLSLFPLILLFGFRYCGTDIVTYENIITRISTMNWNEIFTFERIISEFGFYLLCKIIYPLGGFSLVNIAIGTLICFPVYSVIYNNRHTINVGVASYIFLLSFYSVSFNIMRQFIAVSFVFLAVSYLVEKKGNEFFFYIIIGFLFHKTAVVGLLIYIVFLIFKIKKMKKQNILLLMFCIFIGVIGGVFLYYSLILDSYDQYMQSGAGSNRDFYIIILKTLILFLLNKRLSRINNNNKYYYYLFLITIPIGLTGYFNPYIKRLYYFFNINECMLFSQIQYFFKSRFSVNVIICMMYFILFILTFLVLAQGEIIPYAIKI